MDIIETLTRKGQELADKAKDIYDVNKINMMIHNEEKQMNRRYIALAKKYLKKYEDDIDPEFIDDVETVLNPDNAITCSDFIHRAIHYGFYNNTMDMPKERKPGDTCLWR